MSSVDVIVPCYRYAHYLTECVQSVLTNEGGNVRVLIIDDASPDNTADVAADLARRDSRVTFRRHSQNAGHIATYNEGISWASSDYLLLLSADDYLLPGSLERAAKLMDAHPEVGFTFGKAIDLTDGGAVRKTNTLGNRAVDRLTGAEPVSVLTGPDFFNFIESYSCQNVLRTPTVVVRAQLQKRIGGYRQDLPHAGDLEMWLRFAAHGSVAAINSYQATYRCHEANMHKGYCGPHQLLDLQQRRAAFESILESTSGVLDLSCQQRLLRTLGREAVRYASGAFNGGEPELSRVLSDFAVNMDPSVRHTLRWNALRIKRLLGVDLSRALLRGLRGPRRALSRVLVDPMRFDTAED